jgi:GDPmannose 4,6-dehydratase
MRALITGVTGQDGAYLSKLLLDKGYDVDGLSPRHSTLNTWRLEEMGICDHPSFTLFVGDITCPASINFHVKVGGYDEIYNLGAMTFVAESFNSPIATMHINGLGSVNILEAIKNHSPKTRFYQASTSEMFGNTGGMLNEDSPMIPVSPYGIAKLYSHHMVKYYREHHGIHASAGILFNHESPYRGIEFVSRKICDGVAQIKAGKIDHIELGNLDACRDWGYAGDYVKAMWLMLRQDTPDDYVIATGETRSINYFLGRAFDNADIDMCGRIKTNDVFKRKSDVHILCGDAAKAGKKLGWVPTAGIDTLIKIMMDAEMERHEVGR